MFEGWIEPKDKKKMCVIVNGLKAMNVTKITFLIFSWHIQTKRKFLIWIESDFVCRCQPSKSNCYSVGWKEHFAMNTCRYLICLPISIINIWNAIYKKKTVTWIGIKFFTRPRYLHFHTTNLYTLFIFTHSFLKQTKIKTDLQEIPTQNSFITNETQFNDSSILWKLTQFTQLAKI